MNQDEAKEKILELVERFCEYRNDYLMPDYNEAKVRQDFINPFFKALGRDKWNLRGKK